MTHGRRSPPSATPGRWAGRAWRCGLDIWDVIGPQFDMVLTTGEGFSTYNQMLPMERDGVPRETWWDYSFTPIVDDAGAVLGVLNQGHEITGRVAAETALRTSEKRLQHALGGVQQHRRMGLGREGRQGLCR